MWKDLWFEVAVDEYTGGEFSRGKDIVGGAEFSTNDALRERYQGAGNTYKREQAFMMDTSRVYNWDNLNKIPFAKKHKGWSKKVQKNLQLFFKDLCISMKSKAMCMNRYKKDSKGCFQICAADVMIDEKGNTWFIEINTKKPQLGYSSLYSPWAIPYQEIDPEFKYAPNTAVFIDGLLQYTVDPYFPPERVYFPTLKTI